MSEPIAPKLTKAPFLAGDVLLLAVAGWLAWSAAGPLDLWHDGLVAACVALGAGLAALPFLVEYRTATRLAEAGRLASVVEQVGRLESVGAQVAAATARWQSVQEAADKTARSGQAMADQMAEEARRFTEFMQKAHDAESRHLQLEVEKLHRAEGDWLQVVVRILDHVHAFHEAGLRSGQPAFIEQLGHFQDACRDAARRVGLVPFAAPPDAPFDEQVHQLLEGPAPAGGGRIEATLATGLTFQGQLVRRAVVRLKPAEAPQPAAAVAPSAQLSLEALDEPEQP